MPVTYVDPRGEVDQSDEPYALTVSLTGGGQPTVALLANNFPDSGPFLDAVGTALADLLPAVSVRHFTKPNASAVASEALLAEIAESGCVAVVTAYGH
jgi:hypothetical protein